MNSRSQFDSSLAPGLAARIATVCVRYEDEWLAGATPLLEDFLPLVDEADRPALLRELQELERHYRRQRGEQPQLDLPEQVGRYRVEQEIAHGGMGMVVRVRDEVFDRPLALKVVLRSVAEGLQDRFLREAKLTGQLQHPGIPPVQEMGRLEDGRPYFIMKLVEGQSLEAMLQGRSSPQQDLPRFVAIFEQICQTLGYAHARSIIHRDLKPANIMVGAFGEVQVMDWGLAKILNAANEKLPACSLAHERVDEPSPARNQDGTVEFTHQSTAELEKTTAGSVMGTPRYMAPEQARGEIDQLNQATDVFGLGAILCTILTGKPPFTGRDAQENWQLSMQGAVADAFARLDSCGADPELIALAKKCLAPDQQDRPADAGAVAAAVAAYQALLQQRLQQAEIDKAAALVRAEEETKRREVEQAKVNAERKRRRAAMGFAAAVILLVVGASAAGLWYQTEQVRQQTELAARQERLYQDMDAALAETVSKRQVLHAKLLNPRQFHELLSDMGQWHKMLQEANAAMKRALVLAEGGRGLLDEERTKQLEELKKGLDADDKDWQFGQKLDEARMMASTLVEGKFDYRRAGALAEYPKIFSWAKLDVQYGQIDDLADRIRRSPIRYIVVSGLDHWAQITRDEKLEARLLAVSRQADPHPWRDQFRDVKTRNNPQELQRLAKEMLPEEQSPQIIFFLASRLIINGDKTGKSSVAVLRRSLLHHPRDFWLYFNLGNFTKEPLERVGYFQTAVALRPQSSPAYNNLGMALRDKKDPEEAIKQYAKAIQLDANCAAFYHNRGIALSDKKDLEGAIKQFEKAIELDPNLVPAYNGIGIALYRKKDLEGAIRQFEKAILLDNPDHSNLAAVYNNLGLVLHHKKDPEGAMKQFEKAIQADPNFAQGYNNLGLVLRSKNDLEGAVKQYQKAIQLDPNYALAYYNLGVTLHAKNDLEGAIRQYEKAILLDLNLAPAYKDFGIALRGKKDLEGAIKQFEKAIQADPNYALAYLNLGLALRDKKDLEGAIKQFGKALQLDPSLAVVHEQAVKAPPGDNFPPLLVVSNRSGNAEIYKLDADKRMSNLTNSKAENSMPVYSADGKKIAFASTRDGTWNLFVMDADGSNVQQLTKDAVPSRLPSWSADGKRIAFHRDGDDGPTIFIMDADGGNVKKVGPGYDPALSPDGKKILFGTNTGKGFRLAVMDVEGTHVKQLTNADNIYGYVYPAWSPDGKRMAWADEVKGSLEIFVADADGKNARQLTKLGATNSFPVWSPDGKQIVFGHSGGNTRQIYVIDVNGENPRLVLQDDSVIDRPAWRP